MDEELKQEIEKQIEYLQEELLTIKLQTDIPPHIIREIQQKLDKLILKNKRK